MVDIESASNAVTVVWCDAKESDVRSHWDVGLLSDLIDQYCGEVTHVPLADTQFCFGKAIFIVPGRFFDPLDVGLLNEKISLFDNVVVAIMSDEANEFPVGHLKLTDKVKVWVQTPDPSVNSKEYFDEFLPVGYPAWLRELIPDRRPTKSETWFFSGQITHERREEMAAATEVLAQRGELNATESFTEGYDHELYTEKMLKAKIVPCPSGPETVDTFRIWETLETGGVPLVDTRTPNKKMANYWPLLFGENPLLPLVDEWLQTITDEDFPVPWDQQHELAPRFQHYIDWYLETWPERANYLHAWWSQQKQNWGHRLRSHLNVSRETRDEKITVVLTTAPIPSHPSTTIIEETLDSVREALPNAEIMIMCDGIRSEQTKKTANYREYLRRLLHLANHKYQATVHIAKTHQHQANLMRQALPHIETPTVLFMEDDTPLVLPEEDSYVPWETFIKMIEEGTANIVRLAHESEILKPHQHLMLEQASHTKTVYGEHFNRTIQWSQRPHLASTDYYRQVINEYFRPQGRTMIEDTMHGQVQKDWAYKGKRGWEDHKLWLYTPHGNMKRSTHLDGRGADPKYDMKP